MADTAGTKNTYLSGAATAGVVQNFVSAILGEEEVFGDDNGGSSAKAHTIGIQSPSCEDSVFGPTLRNTSTRVRFK